MGKDSIRFHSTVEVDQDVYNCLRGFLRAKNKDDDIFDRINPSRLNDYLKTMLDCLSAKVFRTYNASITLQKELYAKDEEILDTDHIDKKFKFYNDCNREVARLCNH